MTGWAARGGGRRLRFFRLEVQRQKVYELAREIWDVYLKKARDKPREAVLEIQKCANMLSKLTKDLVELEAGKTLASDSVERTVDEVSFS